MPLWIVICGLGLTQIIGWGTTYYMLGALSQDIALSTGWSGTLIFGAFSGALLLSGLISRWAGRLIDTVGGRRVMMAGSLCAAAGLAVIGLFPHPVTYVAGWLLLGLAMRFATYDAAFASLTQIVGQGARRAISYLTLFGGLASTVFWPVSHYLALGIGWADTLLVYAALNLFVCLPIHWAVLQAAGGDRPAAILFAVLYGASNGLVTIAKGAVPLMLFGTKGYGEVLGVISAPNLILNAAAPLLFALLLGMVSPQVSLLVAGAAAIASTLFMLWLARLHP